MNERVLPVYVVVDVSLSMSVVIEEVNAAMRQLVVELIEHAPPGVRLPIAIASFSDTAKLVEPLTNAEDLVAPELKPEGGTNYGKLFLALITWLRDDVADLRSMNQKVLRPVVFFLTDGSPLNPDWRVPLQALREERFSPTIMAFGFGSADPRDLREIAGNKGIALVLEDDANIPAEIRRVFNFVGSSIQASALSVSETTTAIDTPIPPRWIDVTADNEDEDDWI